MGGTNFAPGKQRVAMLG
jgi:hypothetical protein